MRTLACGFLIAFLWGLCGDAYCAQTSLPEAVRKEFEKKYPDVKNPTVRTTESEGGKSFVLKWKSKGDEREAEFDPEGHILAELRSMKPESLPPDIKTHLEKQYPGHSIKQVNVVTEVFDSWYEFVLETKGGQKLEVEMDSTGKVLSGESNIVEKDLPAPIRATLSKTYPGTKFVTAKCAFEGEEKFYHVSIVSKDRIKREVEFSAGGNIVVHSHEISEESLPKAVRESLQKAYPASKVKQAETEIEEGKTFYHVKIKEKSGMEREVELAPDGKIISHAHSNDDH